MPHKIRGKVIVDTLEIEGELEGAIETSMAASGHPTGAVVTSVPHLPRVEQVVHTAQLTVTDGDTDGGVASEELLTLPSSRVLILGAFLDLAITAVSEEITGTTVKMAVGTAAATTDTLKSTAADLIASTNITLTSGEGDAEGASTTVIHKDGDTETTYYLNLGIAAAGITGNGTVDITYTFRLVYIDLSMGA